MEENFKFDESIGKLIGEEKLINLKRKVLGFCGKKTIKTKDKLVEIISSFNEEKEINKILIENLDEKYICYSHKASGLSDFSYKCLHFKESGDKKSYLITKCNLVKGYEDSI